MAGEFDQEYKYLCSLDGTEVSDGDKSLAISFQPKGYHPELIRVIMSGPESEEHYIIYGEKGLDRLIYTPKRPPKITLFDGTKRLYPFFEDDKLMMFPPMLVGLPGEPTEEELARESLERGVKLAERVREFISSIKNS